MYGTNIEILRLKQVLQIGIQNKGDLYIKVKIFKTNTKKSFLKSYYFKAKIFENVCH